MVLERLVIQNNFANVQFSVEICISTVPVKKIFFKVLTVNELLLGYK
jgi:hypothetical protein